MIITFEGLSGGGKTTQAERLAKKIGFEPVAFFRQMSAIRILLDTARDDDSRSHIFPLSANMMLLHSVSDANRKNVIVHDPQFLSFLAPFFPHQKDFIKAWLNWLDTTYLKPVASFCLKLDKNTVIQRTLGRPVPVLYDDWEADRAFQFYDCLDRHLPYFHIIDGTKNADEISVDIERILRGIDGITFFHR